MTQIALATTGMLGGPGSPSPCFCCDRHEQRSPLVEPSCVAVHWNDEPFHDEYLQLHMPVGFAACSPRRLPPGRTMTSWSMSTRSGSKAWSPRRSMGCHRNWGG